MRRRVFDVWRRGELLRFMSAFMGAFMDGFMGRLVDRFMSGFMVGRRLEVMQLRLDRHRVISRMRGPSGLRGGLTKALDFGHCLPEIAQAAIAQRRLGRLGILGFCARPLGGFRLHLADRFLEGQSLARDIRLVERRLNAAQLTDQRGTRTVIQRATVLARILVESADGSRD